MTEAEWLAATDPTPMLEFLRGRTSDRKLRLFAVACSRRVSGFFNGEAPKAALDVAERFADGTASEEERVAAASRVDYQASAAEASAYSAIILVGNPAEGAAFCARAAVAAPAPEVEWGDPVLAPPGEIEGQLSLTRCVFGNPFCHVAFDPAWRTSTVLALAEGTYADKAFDRLPILADALQDAGCDSDDILNHLRGGGEHVRGCWVVDLLLGRE